MKRMKRQTMTSFFEQTIRVVENLSSYYKNMIVYIYGHSFLTLEVLKFVLHQKHHDDVQLAFDNSVKE